MSGRTRKIAGLSPIFDPGDIVRVPFPFVERPQLQSRPALIVGMPVGPAGSLRWSLMITSARRGAWPGDVPVGPDHASFGLPVPCVVRTAKITAFEANAVEHVLGRLPDHLMVRVMDQIRAALAF